MHKLHITYVFNLLELHNKKHYVYVADNDVAKLTIVQTGIRNNALVEIKSGLNTFDKVIFMGHEKLKDGSKIKIIE